MVFKPSEVTPLPERALAEIVREAGLPPGVVNLLHGDGQGIGAPLSCHPGIDKLSFTGSNPVGEAVMRAGPRPSPGAWRRATSGSTATRWRRPTPAGAA